MNENTSGREEARRAREEARTAAKRIDVLLDSIRSGPLATLRDKREQNHFADKMRAIIRGHE